MSDALTKFVATGKLDFADLANSIISDLVRMEVRILASQALSSVFGGYGGTNGQGGVSYNSQGFVNHVYANGGVVDGSANLSAYSGSVIDHPTLFAFAKGNGLMGEAGPEAIMPLTRGPNGKLGVQASTGATEPPQVEINITNNGQPVQAQQTGQRRDGQKVIIDMVLEAVANDVAMGGKVAKAGQARYGWQRRGVPVGG
jgi:lambda family phage tail tape measure protein